MDHKIGRFDSWTVKTPFEATKRCDKSFIEHHGSGVPADMIWFFGAEELKNGESKELSFNMDGIEYKARVTKESSDLGRIFWSNDLSRAIAAYKNNESDDLDISFYLEDTGVYQISVNVVGGELYSIEQIRQKVHDWGFAAKNISSNMVQLGNKMSSIKRTKANGIIIYSTEEFFESICAAENTIDGIVKLNVIGKSKEAAEAEIEKNAGTDVVICTRHGNKVINPSTAERYLPHEIRIFSSRSFDLVMQAAINKNFVSSGISVNDSIWVAAALLAYEVLLDNSSATKQDMYFRQVDICKKAAQLTDGEVRSARANQWCVADADRHLNNYLRGDHAEKTTLRRLTAPSEFSEKSIPTEIPDSKEFTLKDNSTITFAKLAHFAKTVYTEIIKQPLVIGLTKKEVYPSLDEYNPGITSEEYEKILSDESLVKYNWLDTIYYLFKLGGEATCKQIANEFGNGAPHYNSNAINVAKAVAKETQCPLLKRDNGGTRYWPVLFLGYDMDDAKEGQYCYIMRPPLKEAVERMERNGYFERMTTMRFDHNLILYGPPGTGKTYSTAIYAVAICDDVPVESLTDYDSVMERYNQLKAERRVAFTTFHQSYGYEEFIEGIKPVVDGERKDISYTIEPGTFKKFCEEARRPANMDVDPNASIWFMRLDDDNAKTRKDECFAKGELIVQIKDDDSWSKERFVDSMQIGDYVLSYAGSSVYIDAIGLIEGEAIFDESRQTYQWSRKVKWYQLPEKTNVKEINSNTYLPNFSIAKMSHMKLSDLLRLIPQEKETDFKPYVFVIDEINRGNISKIFGELITLIENTKREGMEEAASAILPYSGEAFSVPSNVYILGTMNTADRSIALMDTALRRRFGFVEMMPKESLLDDVNIDGLNVGTMLKTINDRIEFLFDREHTIGHAFFMGLKKANNNNVTNLAAIFKKSVVPLLQEYFYEDYEKIRLVLGDTGKDEKYQFIKKEVIAPSTLFRGHSHLEKAEKYTINNVAFDDIQSYIGIIGSGKTEE